MLFLAKKLKANFWKGLRISFIRPKVIFVGCMHVNLQQVRCMRKRGFRRVTLSVNAKVGIDVTIFLLKHILPS